MLTKFDSDEIQSYLADASYLRGGAADRVVFPENAEEVADILASATRDKMPVTASGAGTGTVGGRVPFGGIVLASDKLNQITRVDHEGVGGVAVAEPGVILRDLQRTVESKGLLYPPDPTERGCFLGGTVATNASGARSFKYGPTRNYIKRMRIVLATGEMLDLSRGDLHATASGAVRIPLSSGRAIEAQLPTYQMPRVRKHASGYFVEPGMDLLDLFIGSEGTLGVVVEVELKLVPKPEKLLSGVVFFNSEENLLAFVREVRQLSLRTREEQARTNQLIVYPGRGTAEYEEDWPTAIGIDARALEYLDSESLNFLRQKYDSVPADAIGAIFFEQETTDDTEGDFVAVWYSILQFHHAMQDNSWFATNEPDQAKLREFRHQLPVLMNEWFAHHNQRKVSTDMSVPDEAFPDMLRFYQDTLRAGELRYTIFGHIGDNHVHVNILPRNDVEGVRAREIYVEFLKRAASVGGTLSAEHGIGKLKRDYLRLFFSDEHLREMATLKRSFDPAGILGRGNIFSEEYL